MPAKDIWGKPVPDGFDILDALSGTWTPPGDSGASRDTVAGWTRLRLQFGRELTRWECIRVAICAGTALREVLPGRRPDATGNTDTKLTVENPVFDTVSVSGTDVSVLYFDYDSTLCDHYDPTAATVTALLRMADYVAEGSPIRTDNADGRGTKGTRKCHGIEEEGIVFHLWKPDPGTSTDENNDSDPN